MLKEQHRNGHRNDLDKTISLGSIDLSKQVSREFIKNLKQEVLHTLSLHLHEELTGDEKYFPVTSRLTPQESQQFKVDYHLKGVKHAIENCVNIQLSLKALEVTLVKEIKNFLNSLKEVEEYNPIYTGVKINFYPTDLISAVPSESEIISLIVSDEVGNIIGTEGITNTYNLERNITIDADITFSLEKFDWREYKGFTL